MSDLDHLRAQWACGELLRPDPAGPNLVDLAWALAGLAGLAVAAPAPNAPALTDLIGPAEHLVFVLADGLGQAILDDLPEAAFLRRHQRAELRSIFPSTTAAALTTLATGCWPSQHGVTGQWTYLPEIRGTAALLPFAARSGGRLLSHLGVTVEQAFPRASLLRQLPRDVLALFPTHLVNSATTIYFSGSRARLGYETLAQAADAIAARIQAATAPTYTYLYSHRIDAEAHFLGVHHAGVRAVVQELDRTIEGLARALTGRARLVVSADHGLLDAPLGVRQSFRPTPELFSLLRAGVSGDDRVLYFHLREGAAERWYQRFKGLFGDRFWLLSVAEAEAEQLFGPGPIAPEVRERFGDVLMVSSGAGVIEYTPGGPVSHRGDLNAYHSGLSPAEMRVPLIVV